MHNSKTLFDDSMEQARNNLSIYDYCVNNIHLSHENVSDILRYQFIYAVSSFDRLMHDLILKGVLEMVTGTRIKTSKFLSHLFKAETLLKIIEYNQSSFIPTSPEDNIEFLIKNEMYQKLSTLSFQAPDKVKDGLSYIWSEPHKMQILANDMGISGHSAKEKEEYLKQKLQLISERRNQIVHEGDIYFSSDTKRDLTRLETIDAINFIAQLGNSIFKHIVMPSCYVTLP